MNNNNKVHRCFNLSEWRISTGNFIILRFIALCCTFRNCVMKIIDVTAPKSMILEVIITLTCTIKYKNCEDSKDSKQSPQPTKKICKEETFDTNLNWKSELVT